jgi:SAM-dependent methyltransferase
MPSAIPEAYAGGELEALSLLPNYHGWIMAAFAPYLRGQAVEIGAGIGTMSLQIRKHVNRLTAVEPAKNLLPRLAERLAETDIGIAGASAEEFLRDAGTASLDSVVMINVLEHIEDDGRALAECRRALRPGSHLLLFVPALPALFSNLDRSFGHFRRYRRAELAGKLAAAGLAVDEVRYVDLLGAVAWWIVFRQLGQRHVSGAGARLYDRVVVPATRALERVLPVPFGKNLIAIAHA